MGATLGAGQAGLYDPRAGGSRWAGGSERAEGGSAFSPETWAGQGELPWGPRGSRARSGASEQEAIGLAVWDLGGARGPVLPREVGA